MKNMSPHFLSFLTRWIHVAGMAALLGGSLLLWIFSARWKEEPSGQYSRVFLQVAASFEILFWSAVGLLVLTGIGNLGAFGAGLPGLETAWGRNLALKLGLVLVLALFSLPRSLLVARLEIAEETAGFTRLRPLFLRLYAATTILSLAILYLAVSLAHG